MATGQSQVADVQEFGQNLYGDSLHVLRQRLLLLRTVQNFSDTGMQARVATRWSDTNVRTVGEGEDVTPTVFEDNQLSQLTPERHADQFLLTDQMIATGTKNMRNIRGAAAKNLGGGFAKFIDVKIASNFGSLTGGTVGAAGTALDWSHIIEARSRLENGNVMGPYWCTLNPYQWSRLVKKALTDSTTQLQAAEAFNNQLVQSYHTASILGDVTFVVTPSVTVDTNDDAIGAMYARDALAYDQRKVFDIRGQRDESKEATEMNASIWFAHGVWDPTQGIQIISDAQASS